ncbi:MAG: serine hydrolase domain-containing protein [Gemmatimonadales bacterium]
MWAWADSLVIEPPALATSGSPGALLVVVRRDGVVVNRAYGLADVAAGRPASATETLFQLASIGKTMTAAIAAQLIDEGVLDPDVDVNRYLRTARVHGDTVTARMLLTHRGGFDDDITGLFARFDGEVAVPRAELDRRLRPLVTPGVATAYDNQGFGVLGLLLRDLTGKSIPELFRERLFEPAGMTHAVQGRPADGMARLARCYTVQGPGAVQECEYWLYRDAMMGAGGVAASGSDMAAYLRMMLGGGSVDGRTVLSPSAFADLTDFEHYRFHPGMPGGGYAWIQFEERRGLEYAHSGSMPGFSSMLKIYADADVAILFVFLGGQPGAFDLTVSGIARAIEEVSLQPEAKPGFATLRQITDAFAERFIPAGQPRSSERPGYLAQPDGEPIDPYLGTYEIGTNHSRSFFARFAGWGGLVRLERDEGGRLGLAGWPALGQYHQVGSLLYENDRGDRLALANLATGRYLAIGLSGGVFKRGGWLASPGWSLPLFALALLLALTALLQLRRGAGPALRGLARLTLLGLVLTLAGLLAEWQWGITLGIGRGSLLWPALWRLALHLGALALVWAALRYFRHRLKLAGWLGRLHGAVIALSGLSIVAALAVWRVLFAFPPYLSW